MGNLSSPPTKSRAGWRLKITILLVITIGALLLLFFGQTASSFDAVITSPGSIYQPSVVINEIAWMGTKINGVESKNWWRYEWLELYNNTNQNVSLDNWRVELYRTDLDWSLELQGTIPANGYFLIVSSDRISSNYDLNYSNLGGKFINGGQKVLLKDDGGLVINEIDCSTGWFAGDNLTKQTMERKNPQMSDSNYNNWATSRNPGGTPKMENSVVTTSSSNEEVVEKEQKVESQPKPESPPEFPKETSPLIYPTGIFINEILPSPVGPDETEEWIEIFNQNQAEVDLSNWEIADTVGKITIYSFPQGTKIPLKGFLVLSRQTTKITLNNDGDGISLIQPDGKIIETISFSKAPQGQSYNRINEEWFWSTTLTLGSANVNIASSLEEEREKPKIGAPKEETITQAEITQKEKFEAAIGEQIPKNSKSSFILFVALSLALFSGIIILILKIKLRQNKNLLK